MYRLLIDGPLALEVVAPAQGLRLGPVESAARLLPPDYLTQLRRRIFAHPWPLDEHLAEVVRDQAVGWHFLGNPGGQLPYQYLAQYIRALSQEWFEKPLPDLKILDWGCGKGQVSYLLNQAGARVTSADVDPTEGSLILGPTVQSLDHPYELPFETGQFDVVLSVGVLEHVPQEVDSLREIRRVLRPNGLFFCFNLPYKYSWVMWAVRLLGNWYHDRLYGRSQTRQLLQSSNFQVLDLWQRQLLPKNRLRLPGFRFWERLDQCLVENTPLAMFASSLEFVATPC